MPWAGRAKPVTVWWASRAMTVKLALHMCCNILKACLKGIAQRAQQILGQIESKGLRVITKDDLECLARAEEQIAQQRGIPWFKFDKDEDMLKAIEAEKAKAVSV